MDQLDEALARSRQADLLAATRHRRDATPSAVRRRRAPRRHRVDEL